MAGKLQDLPAILRRQGFNLMQDFSNAHEEKLSRWAAKNKWDRKAQQEKRVWVSWLPTQKGLERGCPPFISIQPLQGWGRLPPTQGSGLRRNPGLYACNPFRVAGQRRSIFFSCARYFILLGYMLATLSGTTVRLSISRTKIREGFRGEMLKNSRAFRFLKLKSRTPLLPLKNPILTGQ